MSMNELLARHYGTDKLAAAAPPPVEESQEKLAQYEVFVKLAEDNHLDLTKLSDEQVATLFHETFKTAEATESTAAEGTGGISEEKLAEADFLGRQMAHAYVAEMQNIAKTAAATASANPAIAKVAQALRKTAGDDEGKKDDKGDKEKDEGKDGDKGEKKLPPWLAEKKASIDELAAEHAFSMVQEFNKTVAADARYDEKVAAALIAHVARTGAGETTKLASASSVPQAIQFRALGILEHAGFQVNWGL